MNKAGIIPVMQRIDNEVLKIMIESIEEKGLTYQFASPCDHRLNPAEKTVQTLRITLLVIYMVMIEISQRTNGVK